MRVAALYDIHGNWPALEAVLAEVAEEDVDAVVFGGDVLPGPMPKETLEALTGLANARFVMGNGDRETIARYDSSPDDRGDAGPMEQVVAWTAEQLIPADREFLDGFEPTVEVEVDGLGPTLFCHGSPRSDEEIITSITPESRLLPMLAGVTQSTVVCGHTHRQFEHRLGSRRILNAGAVGMPYEGSAAAYWLLLGPDASFRRTVYDIPSAAERMRAVGFPDVDEILLRESLLEPADPDEVQRIFEDQAVAEHRAGRR